MKSPAQIHALLQKFEENTGIPARSADQGSGAWLAMRMGVVTASNASKAIATKETRVSYMAELVAQVCTGIAKEIEAPALEWGKQNEDAARSCYEFRTLQTVTSLPFVFKDESFRIGCSPDGIVSATKGVEIKCPYSTEHYIKFLAADKLKSEWVNQTQFCMWVLDAEEWDVCQFDPRMRVSPMHIVPVRRDEEKIKVFEDAIPQFISDMDAMLKKIGIEFGSQWRT